MLSAPFPVLSCLGDNPDVIVIRAQSIVCHRFITVQMQTRYVIAETCIAETSDTSTVGMLVTVPVVSEQVVIGSSER